MLVTIYKKDLVSSLMPNNKKKFKVGGSIHAVFGGNCRRVIVMPQFIGLELVIRGT